MKTVSPNPRLQRDSVGFAALAAEPPAVRRLKSMTGIGTLRTKARSGDVDACCRLAEKLMAGEKPSAYRKALPWLRVAARAGDRWAAYSMGLMYDKGLGVPRSLTRAMKWYSRGAVRGYDSAQLNLGILYANLPESRQNLRRAVELYRRAARQGNRNAMYNLGLYYERGRGVPRSLNKSAEWYRKASGAGDREARRRLKELGHDVA